MVSDVPASSMLLAAAAALCVLATAGDARAQSSDLERCATGIVGVRSQRESGIGRIVSVQRGQGRLTFVAVEHSNDPRHPQYETLAALFWEANPSIVFYEGDAQNPVMRTPAESIRVVGEPGLLRHLAERAGVPALSLEPEGQEIHAELLRSFSPEQVQMFRLLRRVRNLSAERGEPWERIGALTDGVIYSEFGPYSAGAWPIRSFSDLEAAFARTWPERSMRDMPRSWFNPTLASTATQSLFLNDVNAMESNFRNRVFYRRLGRALLAARQVFAAAGASHIELLAPALTCLGAHTSAASSPT